jgi:hypothetical protein
MRRGSRSGRAAVPLVGAAKTSVAALGAIRVALKSAEKRRVDVDIVAAINLPAEECELGVDGVLGDVDMPGAWPTVGPVAPAVTAALQGLFQLEWRPHRPDAPTRLADGLKKNFERGTPAARQSAGEDPVADGWLGYIVRDLLAVTHEAVFEAVMWQVDVMSAARQSPALSSEVVASLMP